MIIPPKRIVFTGGGLRSLGYYGVLEVLEERGLLKNIKEYVGVSAGALVGFCAMLGYTIEELKKAVIEFDFSILQNAHPELILDFFSQYGIDSGEVLEKLLKSLMRVKGFSPEMTFGQWTTLHPQAIRLRCYATDLNRGIMREFSYEKSPQTTFLFALRASMSLPFYFVPVKDPETGHLLVDGGVIQNFPMNYLTPEEKESSLGVSFSYSDMTIEAIPDIFSYVSQLYNCSFTPRTYQVQKENTLQCIVIPTGNMTAYNFDLTKEFRENLIELGREGARKYCDNYMKMLLEHKKPIRRFSVH